MSGIAYFKRYQDEERGMLVLVTPDNVILDPKEITLEEFNRLTV
jgi:hypothetical protein